MRSIRLNSKPQDILKPGLSIELPPDQARHGALVLRLEPGDKVEVLNRLGIFPATVVESDRHNAFLKVEITGPALETVSAQGAHLALSLINPQRFEWAVEKMVELGAAVLTPLVAERCRIKKAASVGVAKKERWNRLADAARKQCARPEMMVIEAPQQFDDFLNSIKDNPQPKIYLSPGNVYDKVDFGDLPPILAIGPEGGFTEDEENKLKKASFKGWSLGPVCLRAETAALAALTLVNDKMNKK